MRRFRSSIVQCGVTNVCALAPTVLTASATRFLNVHEYSAKQFLRDAGCRVEYGVLCETIDEVRQACGKISTKQIVVKSQILAGGRGKGRFLNGFQGGVHVCEDASAAIAVAQKMLGETLVTKQTGPEGSKVTKLYLCEVLPKIKKEYYVAFLLDRTTQGPLFIASTEGGMDIEAVAEKTPEKIIKYPIDVVKGLTLPEAQDIAVKLRLENPQAAAEQFVALYQLASKRDATMVEINPFIATSEDQYMCIDAKISFDDNAEFRQSDVWKHEDISQKDPREVAASKWNLNYVGLDGNVGCLVNGAGLAMATMDIISMHGGKPANFLDVGGSANADQVTAALEIIQKDQKVKGILVNIFGGIMKCDTIAKGVVEACRRVGLRVPLVVRLSGTNSEEGKTLLRESALPVHPADDLDEAAGKMMSLIKN